MRQTPLKVWLVPMLTGAAVLALLLTGADEPAFRAINQLRWAPDGFWAAFTVLGDAALLLAFALVLAPRHAHLLPAIFLAAMFAGLWVQILKFLLDVPRPSTVLDVASFHVIGDRLWRHSFPSGHAATVFTAAGIGVLAFDLRAWSALPILVATLVAISRIAVGAHWPLDVLVGSLGGWLAAALGLRIAQSLTPGVKSTLQRVTTLAAGLSAVWLVVRPAFEDRPYAVAEAAVGVMCLSAFAVGTWSAARRPNAPSRAPL